MVSIREELPGDLPEIRRVNELAFGRTGEAQLVDALRDSIQPFISLVAVCEGKLAGHILFTPVTLQGAATAKALSLAPMAVTPEFQRQGVGSHLIRKGLEQCLATGHAAVFVLGHPEYYPRFGFKPAQDFGIRCEFPCPPEAFMVVELRPDALRGVQGMVTYPASFHALE